MDLPIWTQLLKETFSQQPKSLVSETRDFLIRSQWLWLYTESCELHHQRFQLLSAGRSTMGVDEGERMWQDEHLESLWKSTDSTHDIVAFTIWLVACCQNFEVVRMRKVPFWILSSLPTKKRNKKEIKKKQIAPECFVFVCFWFVFFWFVFFHKIDYFQFSNEWRVLDILTLWHIS